ncbi:APC family permease [Bacillus sp. GM2]|jgi:amino acid transporter|uniref:Amino acid/polyamine transporter I n=4 Tax=Bacillus subtilis group TaxID=653685 RepID=Q65ND3_BACLD|nr:MULTISPECIES: APC family permease [Bacillus]MBY8349065.1 APC family permease [Bacillus sp. PCH94]MDP4081810.1 APC family permease [Bacillota bacterium]AAU22074.1 Amino acid/polyamine transporter I [Bacillus licheniformis DSM 13 = ATCC 14580]AAU39431.1 putative amino acid permease YhdG [Bacillus licheniformis DSM 13 = ATCC 14580]AKQ71584.1 amino acid/polyamine transporter I [Bacillus licheniformis WX-02]
MGKQQMKKTMSQTDVLFLAIGAMLGWGWVVLSGDWISTAGFLGSTIAFIIGGILVILIGLTYAELSSAIPETGGGLIFVYRAFGRKTAFVAAWGVLFGYVSVITFEAVALPTVIDYVLPVEHQGFLWSLSGWDVYVTWVLIGSGGAVVLTALNYFGVKPAAIFQSVFTIAIIATGFLLLGGALVNGDFEHVQPLFKDGFSGMMSVLVMIPFLFVGFDVIPQVAAEINAPKKIIGKILIISIISAVVFYLLIVFGVTMGLSESELATTSLATADAMVNLLGNQLFGTVLVLGGVAGIITSWNAFIIGASRILFAMSEKGMVPKWFGFIHPKYKTPTNAILFLGALAFFAPLLGRPALVWIVNAGGTGIIVGYLIVSIAFMKLRKTEPDLHRPYKINKWKTTGISAILLSVIFLAFYLPGMPAALTWPYEWLILAGWTLIGFLLYNSSSKRKGEEIQHDQHARSI